LIVSTVKICKQYLQTASVSGDPYRGFAPGPVPDSLGYNLPKWKFLASAQTDHRCCETAMASRLPHCSIYWRLHCECSANIFAVYSSLKTPAGSSDACLPANCRYRLQLTRRFSHKDRLTTEQRPGTQFYEAIYLLALYRGLALW